MLLILWPSTRGSHFDNQHWSVSSLLLSSLRARLLLLKVPGARVGVGQRRPARENEAAAAPSRSVVVVVGGGEIVRGEGVAAERGEEGRTFEERRRENTQR